MIVSKEAEKDLPRVLVVDDSDQLLFTLNEVLTAQGYKVLRAQSVDEALQILRLCRPDVIISDIMMPDVDGFRFHDRIKQSEEWCDIPFIFLSALSDPEEVRFGKQLGCDEYVTKPFDPQDLTAIVRGKIDLSRRRNQKQEGMQERYRKRIIHTLSHEFRTPLVAINTGTELLIEQKDHLDDTRLERLLESIQRGGLRLQRLVEDFMTMQQIDSGSAASLASRLCRKMSLDKILDVAIDCFQEVMHLNKGLIEVRTNSQEQLEKFPPLVSVYDIQVASIIQRVLSNALKFTAAGKPVQVWITSDENRCAVVIRDFGPGMSPEAINAACQLFHQVDRERLEQQGCGLGLTIARAYAELNGAELLFRSPPDAIGLEVEIRFPRVK